MRRSPLVLAGTLAGTAGVFAFHAHAAPVAVTTTTTTTATPAATASRSGASGTATGASGTATGASGTATGDAVDTPYGAAQVKVTVSGGKITSIEAVQLQGDDPRSVQISSSAEPVLQQEALTAQSADIDAVSGATFTSESYTQSLQSALDKLGFDA